MARIINTDKAAMGTAEDKKTAGGRKLSFKTRGGTSGSRNCRVTKVSVLSNSVQALASKFNAVVVEDETKGRALLKKLHSSKSSSGSVKEAVRRFENIVVEKPTMVVVRKSSKKLLNTVKEESTPDGRKSQTPPPTKPKPASWDTKHPKIKNKETGKDVKLSIPKNHSLLESILNEVPIEVKPNTSFLWRNDEKDDITNDSKTPFAKEDKENEKVDLTVERSMDRIGYGRINSSSAVNEEKDMVKGNVSTLYPEAKITPPSPPPSILTENKSYLHRAIPLPIPSESGYEDISIIENSYDVITYGRTEGEENEEDAIYDDVLNINDSQNDSIYESIYDTRPSVGAGSSDSSYEHSNSLYEIRPSSRSSSASGPVQSGASRSDTSDDWIDIEMESTEEHKEEILVLQDTSKPKFSGGSWSQKVRKQWSNQMTSPVAITSTSAIYFVEKDLVLNTENDSQKDKLFTKGLVSLRDILYSGLNYEIQEVTVYMGWEGDDITNGKIYETLENHYDPLLDDFDDSSDSEISTDQRFKPKVENQPSQPNEGIYGFMRSAGKKMRKTSLSIGQRLRRISRISMAVPTPTVAQEIDIESSEYINRGKWTSFKRKSQSNSTFYLDSESLFTPTDTPSVKPVKDPRRNSASIRPKSPPPPPPPPMNGESKPKLINDTSLYMECGLFDNLVNERKHPNNGWYSDVGLYENNKTDTTSEHDSSQGSDLDLRFADEPLYQFYAARVAELEREDVSEVGYEEIGKNQGKYSDYNRPSALDLVSPEMQRTLWSHVPQVIKSGILDTLTPERRRLQEAKFELITSEASYYKSLAVLEKHFSGSSSFKDESILPKVHYKTLFGNVLSVRKCSEAVLAALEKCWQESILLEGVCDIACQLVEDKFQSYIKYCKHQVAIERTLKTLKKTNSNFVDALSTLESSPICHSLSLYSFLLLPMQRITRMPLLMDAIFTKLDPNDPEYEPCRNALAKINKVVHDCDESAKQTERMEEMAILSQSLHYPANLRPLPLLSASRWLVRSGQVSQVNMEPKLTLSKKLTTGRSTTKLMLFLFTDYLIAAKKKGEDNYSVVTYCQRNLVQMSKVDDPISNKYLIMITLIENHEGKTQEMVVNCGSEISRERWLQPFESPKSSDPNETLYESWDCPQVSATHPYSTNQPDELALQTGDVVNVLSKLTDGWYFGERIRDGKKGWFPGSYTVEIASSHVRARNLKQRHRLLALSSDFIQQKQKSVS